LRCDQSPLQLPYRDYQNLHELSFEKVTTVPFHIWKLEFDFASINENLLLRSLQNDPRTKYVQFNHLIEERVIPNDPGFIEQWQYMQSLGANGENHDLDAELAWDITTGGLTVLGDTIVACVIDDGLDGDHEDFGDNIWFNHEEIPDNEIDDDGNGYVDDFYGWDIFNNNGDVYQDGSHGTPVTGIIGAQGDNDIGVAGVNWNIKLMVVRGGGNEANALAAYSYPYYFRKLYNDTDGARGAFVVVTNASWGTDNADPASAPLWCNFYDALGEEGIISCGATANNGVNIDVVGDLPTGCSSDYLIAVTNMNQNDEKEPNAGYGIESIDLGAFGAGTWTTNGNNGYSSFGGTSGATPHVAGTIALLYAAPCSSFASLALQDPGLSAILAKQYVLDGVEPNESLEGITTTGGRLNINNAVLGVMANCSGCPLATNVEFNNANLNGFDLSWEQASENEEINLRYKSELDNDWTVVENVTSPYTISAVESCTNYIVELQSVCDGESNIYFGNYQFKSEGCCAFANDDNTLEFLVAADYGLFAEVPEILAADNYSLEYKSFADDDWIVLSPFNFTNQFLVNNLEGCTRYQFRSQLVCQGIPADYFYFDDYTTSCGRCTDAEYCDIPFADNSLEWIAEVTFNEESFASTSGLNGYESMVGIKSFTFRRDQYVDLTLTPNFLDQIYDEFWKVYIDYDGDGVFGEIDNDENNLELVYESAGISDTTNVGQFKIPLSANIGFTRMRIVMNWDGPAFSCGGPQLQYGEVEDYCVFIDEQSGVTNPRFDNIELYPNPASDIFRLKNVFEPGILEIYTAEGKLIRTEHLSGLGDYEFGLDQGFEPGVYFVVYQTAEGNWSEKLVKI